MRVIVVSMVLAIGALSQCAIAQERANLSCLTPEQLESLKKELLELRESHRAQSLEIGRDLADAIGKTRAASDAYANCTSNVSFVGSLLGDDCTREKSIMDMMSNLVESQGARSKFNNDRTQTKLMLIRNKYPTCN